jgi:hypothetical protein
LDITQLILDDHREQRRLFAILDQIDDADTESLAAVWGRLAAFLEVHAKAEEEFFYPTLLKLGKGAGGKATAADETVDAIKDHNEIRDAVAAVSSQRVGSGPWRKAVAAANKANGEHMDEEERQGLADFRRQAALKVRHDLAVQFTVFEAKHVDGVKPVDLDPKTYVADHAA